MSRANDLAYPATRDEPWIASDGTVVGTHAVTHGGLTIREVFAMAAMQGILASNRGGSSIVFDVAAQAREQADALLDELAQEPRK